jgi:hypothetical protein
LRELEQKRRLQSIEKDEWRHREQVGEILRALGEKPSPWLEFKAAVIGRSISLSCFISGWLAPMFGAGFLESKNIEEYVTAARHAQGSGHDDFIDALLDMAEVEWDHEHYFRSQVLAHRLGRRLPIWPAPAPRETIRATFSATAGRT